MFIYDFVKDKNKGKIELKIKYVPYNKYLKLVVDIYLFFPCIKVQLAARCIPVLLSGLHCPVSIGIRGAETPPLISPFMSHFSTKLLNKNFQARAI